ncbi:MAG TPA: CsbD family protein [Candidatus Limnocylindria bacterium]|nr:CsbD family protein [Candidatus Limnocylindria bacterium]
MNEDILSGQWKQMKGSLKSWWGQFSDDDFDRIDGQKDRLVGWVQEKYGRTREQATQEVNARLKEYNDKYGGTVAELKAKAHDIGETVVGKANEAASAVRSGVEKASSYFQEKTLDSMGSDITALVRKYPIQSVLIGIGVGIWLARGGKH